MAEKQVVLPRRVVGKARSQVVTSSGRKDQQFPVDNLFDPNWQVTDVRTVTDPSATLRQLFHADGLVSSVIVSMVQMAMSGYKVMAYDTGTHRFSPAGHAAAAGLLASWDTVWDYTIGYSEKEETKTIVEMGLLEAALTGGVGGELVLDKNRIPQRLQLFPYDTINWKGDGKENRYPSQQKANPKPGEDTEVSLNLPTVWVGEVLKTARLVYNLSFLASGFKRLFHYDELLQDIRRVVRSSGGPRVVVTLDYQKTLQSAPVGTQKDPDKLATYLEGVRSDIETVLKDLQPEDALVVYDLANVASMATVGEKSDYRSLLDAMSGLTASAMKANPSILGLRLGGSQNVASTESLLFTKVATALQKPVAKVLSRALTLGIRLLGIDAYVKFQFDGVNLRPDLELEGLRSIKQNRILEQLSLGMVGDYEASVLLGAGSPEPGMPGLSGTMFRQTKEPSKTPTPNQDTNSRQQSADTASGGGSENDLGGLGG